MDWIDCFPIFVFGVVCKSSFLEHIMYFNYVLDQHPGNNSEKYLELLYVLVEGKFKGLWLVAVACSCFVS